MKEKNPETITMYADEFEQDLDDVIAEAEKELMKAIMAGKVPGFKAELEVPDSFGITNIEDEISGDA